MYIYTLKGLHPLKPVVMEYIGRPPASDSAKLLEWRTGNRNLFGVALAIMILP